MSSSRDLYILYRLIYEYLKHKFVKSPSNTLLSSSGMVHLAPSPLFLHFASTIISHPQSSNSTVETENIWYKRNCLLLATTIVLRLNSTCRNRKKIITKFYLSSFFSIFIFFNLYTWISYVPVIIISGIPYQV